MHRRWANLGSEIQREYFRATYLTARRHELCSSISDTEEATSPLRPSTQPSKPDSALACTWRRHAQHASLCKWRVTQHGALRSQRKIRQNQFGSSENRRPALRPPQPAAHLSGKCEGSMKRLNLVIAYVHRCSSGGGELFELFVGPEPLERQGPSEGAQRQQRLVLRPLLVPGVARECGEEEVRRPHRVLSHLPHPSPNLPPHVSGHSVPPRALLLAERCPPRRTLPPRPACRGHCVSCGGLTGSCFLTAQ